MKAAPNIEKINNLMVYAEIFDQIISKLTND